MAIIRWEPFREIESIQQQMNQIFDRMTTATDRDRQSNGTSFIPAAEIHETDNEVKLHMEVPGVDAKDLDIKVTEDAVAITGERKSKIENEDRGMRRSEFRYGRFQRIIPLPSPIQNDKVQADFQNGVLSLTMPKSEQHQHKVVSVSLPGQQQQQMPSAYPQSAQMPSGQMSSGMPATASTTGDMPPSAGN
jgi:HSP20 family protein